MHRFQKWKRWRDSVLSQRQTAPRDLSISTRDLLPARQTRREILITFRRAFYLEMMRDRDNGITVARSGRFSGKKMKVPPEQNSVVAAL
jgi:hypothetical protein